MKILDEKGRLFGKVNLIDLLVVLLIVFAIGAVGWKMLGSQVTAAVDSIRDIPAMTYEVRCIEIDPEVAEYSTTQIGTQLMSNGELMDGYITGVVVEDAILTLVDANGNTVEAVDPYYKVVTYTIEANVEPTANAYAVGSQEVRAGKTHVVKTVTLEVAGIITTMEEAND